MEKINKISTIKKVSFNVYFVNDYVEVTLIEGQSKELDHSEPTEEGYSYNHESFYFRPDGVIERDISTGGRDCDGEHGHYSSYVLNINDEEPDWTEESSSQYDQYAEMDGY